MRLTQAAMADLEQMVRKGDPQVVRWALKKCLLLERNPEAGEELRGTLIGYRKLVVGDRDWRVVWRVTHDTDGAPVVDVAEVWAVGARSDADVYAEMTARVTQLSRQPATVPLADAIQRLGKVAAGVPAQPEPAREKLPPWLVQVLTRVVGLPEDEVSRLTRDQAERLWTDYTSQPG